MNDFFGNSTQKTGHNQPTTSAVRVQKFTLNTPDSLLASRLFKQTAIEVKQPVFKKSYAQVASSVAPDGSPVGAPHSMAGLRPRPQSHKSRRSYGVKLKDGELEILKEKAAALNMSVNAYIRAKALGEDYIEKPPSWLRDALLKIYLEMSRQGNNLNQIARKVNNGFVSAEEALAIADQQRAPMFRLMKHLEMALAGRRPPHDY